MHNKIVFTLSICLFLLLPIAYADGFLGYYKKGTSIDIKVPCELNSYTCQSSASCNLTVINPNTLTLVNNSPMNNNLAYFYYNLDTTNTNTIGDYLNIVNCKDGNLTSNQAFYITINNSGLEPLNYSSLLPLIIGFIMIIVYFTVMGLINLSLHNNMLKTFSFTFSFIELVIMIGMLYINEYGGVSNELLRINFYGIAIIGFGLLVLTLVNISMNNVDPYETVEDKPKWQPKRTKW